jgi:tetratricopeptide (TPR) repeat protein
MMFARYLPASVYHLPEMPAWVQRTISVATRDGSDELRSVSPLCSSLATRLRRESEKAGNSVLSLSVLAFLLEEEQFVLVVNNLLNASDATEHSLDEQVSTLLPIVRRHRYAPFVDSFQYHPLSEVAARHDALGMIRCEDPRQNMYAMLYVMQGVRDINRMVVGKLLLEQAVPNYTLPAMLEFLEPLIWSRQHPQDEIVTTSIETMNTIAPHCDVGVYLATRWKTDADQEQLRQWESRLKHDPRAFAILAQRYRLAGDTDGAIRCFERSLELEPAIRPALMLADLYRERQDWDKWEQTLLARLDGETLGLEYSEVQQALAYGYAQRGQWQRAEPHAIAAAQSWSAKGLVTASTICEGLAQWEESERWIRAASESYPSNNGFLWYFWCQRTGRGDLNAARQLAGRTLQLRNSRDAANLQWQGIYYLLEGDKQRALQAFRGVKAAAPGLTAPLVVAQLARELGDVALQRDALGSVEKFIVQRQMEGKPIEPMAAQAAVGIVELARSDATSPQQLKNLEIVLGKVEPVTRSRLAWLLGNEFQRLGHSELAETYWRRSLILSTPFLGCSTVAGMQLARLHGTSRPDDDVLNEEDLWPTPPESNDIKKSPRP